MFYSVTDWSSFGIDVISYQAILTYTCYLLEGLCFILYDKKWCTKNNSACIYRLPLIMYQYMSTIIERVFVYGIFFLVSVKNANTTLSHLLSVDMLPCCCNIWVGSPVIFVDSQLYLNKWQDPKSGQPCNQWKYLLLVISMYLIKQFCHSVISTSTACIVKYL